MTELMWMIAERRYAEARALCGDILSGRRDSRFSMHTQDLRVTDSAGNHPTRSVFEHALMWLDRTEGADPAQDRP